MRGREKHILVLVFSGLVVLKGLLLFAILPVFQHSNPGLYNADLFPDNYDRIALNLLEGNGYRVYPDTSETLIRTPGFVVMLAGIFAIAGKSLPAVKVFNLLLSLVTGWMLYTLAFRLTGSRLTSLTACLLFLLHPGMVIAESRGGVEVFFTFSIVLFLWLFYRALETLRYRDFTLAGAALGFGLLIKSTIALVLPALFLYSLARQASRASLWKLAGLYAASAMTAFLILSPWVIRNYKLTGKFIPTMTIGGLAAFQGLYVVEHRSEEKQQYELFSDAATEQARIADAMGLPVRHGFFPQFYSATDEVRYYKALGDKVKAKYQESPSLLVRVVFHNLWGFWFQGRTTLATALNMVLTIPFLFLFVIGTFAAVRRKHRVGPLLLLVGSFVAAHLHIIALARYYIPLVPLMAVPAALPIALVLLRWRPSLECFDAPNPAGPDGNRR
jgi:4-amino-4-deoxy-L-arabinose transferase-like glycosyltransferase